ncbi:MAG: protein translocase SEC61 complex subunit gamma [Candidatus Diapherotrites archaeon]|nr:protein translocase SEC61 complex subunit gamma [Candidatus Diapherotrites archaeon]
MYGTEQTGKVTIRQRISEFIGTSRRILIVSQKPSWLEYKTMAKITALGIALIAVIDYVITLAFRLLGLGI